MNAYEICKILAPFYEKFECHMYDGIVYFYTERGMTHDFNISVDNDVLDLCKHEWDYADEDVTNRIVTLLKLSKL